MLFIIKTEVLLKALPCLSDILVLCKYTWRELIKKVWEIGPLTCPRCSSEMLIIRVIQDPDVIRRILAHLGLFYRIFVELKPALRNPH